MNNNHSNIHFERRAHPIPRRLITVGVSVVVVIGAWRFMPPSSVVWFIACFVAVLAWVASFGWRQALVALHDAIHRLEQL